MTLGDIIKAYRNQHCMSMDSFAEKSGISKAYISLLEKNRHPKTGNTIAPSVAIIQSAAKAMNMDFDELFSQLTGCVSVNNPDLMSAYIDLERALKRSGAVLRGDADGNAWLQLPDGHTIELQSTDDISEQSQTISTRSNDSDDLANQPQTIAAHFDGTEYTEDELEEIKQFAEFVKNKRK